MKRYAFRTTRLRGRVECFVVIRGNHVRRWGSCPGCGRPFTVSRSRRQITGCHGFVLEPLRSTEASGHPSSRLHVTHFETMKDLAGCIVGLRSRMRLDRILLSTYPGRRSQVVRQRSAKPPSPVRIRAAPLSRLTSGNQHIFRNRPGITSRFHPGNVGWILTRSR